LQLTLGIMIASPILLLAPTALLWEAKWRGRHYPDVMAALMFGNL